MMLCSKTANAHLTICAQTNKQACILSFMHTPMVCALTSESVTQQVKTDEYTMHNFHVVKYCHVTHFGSPLGLAGLAVVWLVASQDPYSLFISSAVFKVMSVCTCLFVCMCLLA